MTEVPHLPGRPFLYDSSLRDGMQAPGMHLDAEERVEIALGLAEAGIDAIEAGSPMAGPLEAQAVRAVAEAVDGPLVGGFSTFQPEHIETTWAAIEPAKHKGGARINICLPVSDILMKHSLHMTPEEVVHNAVAGVKTALEFTPNVQFSAEDATRADRHFLERVVTEVTDAGATTVMLPDTVGQAMPWQYGNLLATMHQSLEARGLADCVALAAHCHDDRGLATANTLFALTFGRARQAEATLNGFGERAGNAALEQLVGLIYEHPEFLGGTDFATERLTGLAERMAYLAGVALQPNRPFVGANSRKHSSGMHVNAMLSDSAAYDSLKGNYGREVEFVFGELTGKSLPAHLLAAEGLELTTEQLKEVTDRAKDLSHRERRNISSLDMARLAAEVVEGQRVAIANR